MNLLHKSSKSLIAGASGTGKTTYLVRMVLGILHKTPAIVYVFDHQGDISERLGVQAITDYDGLIKAVEQKRRLIVFDPADLYPGDLAGAFQFFCDFVFTAASNFDGPKIFVCDEVQMVSSTDSTGIPETFSAMLETGRRQEIDVVLVSSAVNLCHNRIRNQATEVIVFNLGLDSITAQYLASRGFDLDSIPSLPEGAFIARDVRRGIQTTGFLFRKKVVDSPKKISDIAPVTESAASE